MKIFLIGSFGQNNFGDDLLLEVFLRQLRPLAESVHVNSDQPQRTRQLYKKFQIETVRTRHNKRQILATIAACDLIIFAGGNILQELEAAYGGSRYFTLLRVWAIVVFAKLLRKKIILAGIGISSLRTRLSLRIAGSTLKRADLISLRDSTSVKYLKSIGVKKAYKKIPDTVFASNELVSLATKTVGSRDIQHSQKIRVGINICRNIRNPSNWGNFFESLSYDLIGLHEKMPEIEYVGLPMQYDSLSSNDHQELDNLKRYILKRDSSVPFRLIKPINYKDVARLIKSVDIVVAERLHALITATMLHKPFLMLSYDEKIEGFANDLGIQMPFIDISRPIQKTAVSDSILNLIHKHSSYQRDLRTVARKKNERANTFFKNLTNHLLRMERLRG